MFLKRLSFYLLACFFLLLAFGFQYKQAGLLDIFEKINREVEQNSKAYEMLGRATNEIGHRLTGSPQGHKAEEFAHKMLHDFGLTDARFFSFEVEAWARDTVSLHIGPANSDNIRQVEVVSLAHSPISALSMGKIMDCGDGLSAEFDSIGTELKDKIALINLGLASPQNKGKKNLHRSEKTALAIQHGAKGVIMVNQVKGGVLLTGTASVTGELIPIPAVCISLESGVQIRRWIQEESPILAQINMRNYSRPIRARNVVASIRGSSRKLRNEKIIVGGHPDSWDLAQGAVDNGIGSFSILDVARTFKSLKLRPKRTIEFVLFMGEEQGLLGSKAYVKQLKERGKLDQVKLMINLDMTNNPKGFNAYGRDEMKILIDEIGAKINKIDTSYSNTNRNEAGLHSDHQSFMLEGIPVLSPEGKLPISTLNCYHADCDSFGLIDTQHIKNNVRFTAMMLYGLADADKIPAKRFSSEETRDFLIKQKLKEELVLGKEWRWE